MGRRRKRNGSRKRPNQKKADPTPIVIPKSEIQNQEPTLKELLLKASDEGDLVEYNGQLFTIGQTDEVDEWKDPLRRVLKFLTGQRMNKRKKRKKK